MRKLRFYRYIKICLYYCLLNLMDSIWADMDACLEEFKEIKKEHLGCLHDDIETHGGFEVCNKCGEVVGRIFEQCEWSNFKNDDGSYQKSTQRGDAYNCDNPYTINGTVPGFNKNSFLMRLHYQQTFSHKQKTFWKTSERFSDYCGLFGLPDSVLTEAKNMWHLCMESGVLTRASVRNGLIASCLYYASIHNNIPIDRQTIIDGVDGNNKGFLKGEKIFMQIMENNKKYSNLGKTTLDIKDNDSFIKFTHTLELPFKVSTMCNQMYEKYKDRLDSVTPKSAIAGILFHVVKNELGLKTPSKSKISTVVKVCIPTINKVLNILEK